MQDANRTLTPQRYGAGLTFQQYLDYLASPANLGREGAEGGRRTDRSTALRDWYQALGLADAQVEALRWLRAQPGGPAKILALSEEWSSDCRRDIPMVARLAEAAGMELRIFTRDGQRFGRSQTAAPDGSPNADLMDMFLKEKDGETWQSIPVVAFFSDELTYLYHYQEYPAIYDKDRLVVGHIRSPKPGESPEQTSQRGDREFGALQASSFWRLWAGAAVDEMISALHRRLTLGTV